MLERLPAILIEYLCEYLSIQEMSIISELNKYLYRCIHADLFYSHCKMLFEHHFDDFLQQLKKNDYYFHRLYPKINIKGPVRRYDPFVVCCKNNYYMPAKYFIKKYYDGDDYCYLAKIASEKKNIKILKFLIQHDICLDKATRNDLFQCVCVDGHLDVAKEIIDIWPDIEIQQCHIISVLCSYDRDTFVAVCGAGEIIVAQWLYEKFTISDGSKTESFYEACAQNKIDVAKWLYKKISQDDQLFGAYVYKRSFRRACINKTFDVVKWLTEVGKSTGIISSLDREDVMETACNYTGNKSLEMIKWLENDHPIIKTMSNSVYDRILQGTFNGGEKNLAKWLIKTRYSIEITEQNLFQTINENNQTYQVINPLFFDHLNVVEYLIFSCPRIDLKPSANYIFKYVCSRGNLDVAKYLEEKLPADVINLEDTFCSVCSNGHIEIVKWLTKTYPNINIRAKNDLAFKLACENNHLKVVAYLQSKCTNYNITKIKYNVSQ